MINNNNFQNINKNNNKHGIRVNNLNKYHDNRYLHIFDDNININNNLINLNNIKQKYDFPLSTKEYQNNNNKVGQRPIKNNYQEFDRYSIRHLNNYKNENLFENNNYNLMPDKNINKLKINNNYINNYINIDSNTKRDNNKRINKKMILEMII